MTQQDNKIPNYRLTPQHRRMLGKSGAAHKYDHGHAVVVSGPPGQGGAARLAARGALRMGAGLVSVFTSPEGQPEHAARLDAIMVKSHKSGTFAEQLSALKPSAICTGPNLGLDQTSAEQLFETLSLELPMCLDADAITHIARAPDRLGGISLSRSVMTPHEGELRRLIPEAFERTSCRTTLARTAARKMGCCVLFKGPDTIIARPDGGCVIVRSGPYPHAAWLATAGSGDVLSGFVTGLMARGFEAFDATALGAHLHLQAAQQVGPGLIAEDLPEALPAVLAQILTQKED